MFSALFCRTPLPLTEPQSAWNDRLGSVLEVWTLDLDVLPHSAEQTLRRARECTIDYNTYFETAKLKHFLGRGSSPDASPVGREHPSPYSTPILWETAAPLFMHLRLGPSIQILDTAEVLPSGECTRSIYPTHMKQRMPNAPSTYVYSS